jgi:hypothetical protein
MIKRTRVLTMCLATTLLAGRSLASEPASISIGFVGPQFLALSVKELEPMAHWYTETFALTLIKDLPAPR